MKPFDVLQVTSSLRSDEHLFDDRRTLMMKSLNFQQLPATLEEVSNLNKMAPDLILFRDPSASFEYMVAEEGEQPIGVSSYDLLEAAADHLDEGRFVMIIFRSAMHEFESIVCSHLRVKLPDAVSTQKLVSRAFELGFVQICLKQDPVTGFVTLLLRKALTPSTSETIVNMKTLGLEWIAQLQKGLKENAESEDKKKKIWLTCSDSNSGLIGFMKCIRKEGAEVRALLESANVGMNQLLTDELRKMDLVMNVFEDGKLGSFQHKSVSDSLATRIMAREAYLDFETKGDLSSLKFYESPADQKATNKYSVHYSALNFKDVMVASGRIPLSAYPEMGGNLGMEFSGVDENGNRIMGMTQAMAMASFIAAEKCMTWKVPDHMTLEDASTIPVVYLTVYYSLFIRGNMSRGQSVLIHSGTGGVGQAALNVCISMGCEIFTTVGSEEKKKFILKNFPEVKEDHILNSRNPDFEYDVLRMTGGKGVDIVLNSLTGQLLKASLRCLAEFGRFLEIGKYDIIKNSPFGKFSSIAFFHHCIPDAADLWHNRTFEVICLASFMDIKQGIMKQVKMAAHKLLQDGLDSGVVKPLTKHIYDHEHAEDAFRFMASGKHMGKVLIKFKEEVNPNPDLMILATASLDFDPNKSYIIIGGLGGMGLELGLWLLKKGAKNLILTSRSGVRTSYHKMAIKRFESYGGTIWVSKLDVSDLDQARALIMESEKIGPVGAIFNLALQLSDASFDNQTVETFNDVGLPKANGTVHLDSVSRELCRELDHFVCFSSIVSALGNGGQSNYGIRFVCHGEYMSDEEEGWTSRIGHPVGSHCRCRYRG